MTRLIEEGGEGGGVQALEMQRPSGEAEPFTSADKMAAMSAMVLAALFVGDNGQKSKTDGLLRGNTEPASELIKQLLCISEGAVCLMSDTKRGNLATLWPCKKKKERGQKKQKALALIIYGACHSFTVNSLS